jgi:hypothetical protein
MKYSTLLVLTFVSAISFAQKTDVIVKGDSVIVRDESIASDPFKFGRNPLTYLKSKKRKLPRPVIEISTIENTHVQNQVDTVYEIKFKRDSFRIYKGGGGKNFLLDSKIESNKFATKHGIKVGMTKSQIISLLKIQDIQTIPKYLILENTEFTEYLKFEFSRDVLRRIEFQGYFD